MARGRALTIQVDDYSAQVFTNRGTVRARNLEMALRIAAVRSDVVSDPADLEIRSVFDMAQLLDTLLGPEVAESELVTG